MGWYESLTNAREALSSNQPELCQQWLKHAMPESQDDLIRRAVVLNNLGLYYYRQQQLDKAIHFFQQALQACLHSWLRGRIFANWGVLEHRRGDLIAARRLYQDALKCCSEPVEDKQAIARLCINFACLHLQQDRYPQANSLLCRAQDLLASYPDDMVLQCRYFLVTGRAAMACKRLSKAERDFLKATRIMQQLPYFDKILMAQCRAALANCYSLQCLSYPDLACKDNGAQERKLQADQLFRESIGLLEESELTASREYMEALFMAVDHFARTAQWEISEHTIQKLLNLVTASKYCEPSIKIEAWEKATQILHQVNKADLAKRAARRVAALRIRLRELSRENTSNSSNDPQPAS